MPDPTNTDAPLRVLAADDEEGVRALIEGTLEDEPDIEVRCVSSAAEALDCAQEYSPDVVLTDLAMPNMDGFELTERLLAMDLSFQVLVLSGHLDSDEDANRGLQAGIVGYVDKPFSPQDLLINVRAAGRNRRRWLAQKREMEEMNQQLQLQQQHLLQSEKMASIGQLAAGVAHEINNPVGFVMSNVGTLREYIATLRKVLDLYQELDQAFDARDAQKLRTLRSRIKAVRDEEDLSYILADVDELLGESKDGCERIRDIVLNLKSFARADDAQLKEADINEGIEATLKIVWNELKYKCTVHKDLNPLPLVRCYMGQLNQVFTNLLVNASHAIEDKGEITIHTEATDEHIVIQVSDTGSGIAPEHAAKLFDPFFTTKEVGKGTGLGLAIAHGIVQTHNGTIDVESEVGKRTTFTIRLPIRGVTEDD